MDPLIPHITDIGSLAVRRFLPQKRRRMVGAWCFLDAFGPAVFARDKAMDVAPHPHMGLQTVTWLFEGEALHKDSLDSEALARPGALNLMTSGRGIAHSEETPEPNSHRLHGVQLWVALPDEHRHQEPSFDHHPDRPVVELGRARVTVIAGELAGVIAPARTFSPLLGADITLEDRGSAVLPLHPEFEHGLLTLDDGVEYEGQPLAADHLYHLPPGKTELGLSSRTGATARLLLLGGAPFGEPIVMWWNFVARTADEISAARADWQSGQRFGEVRRYAGPRLAAPAFLGRPVAANPMS
jgi:quercetin 2,3-dioxygenase